MKSKSQIYSEIVFNKVNQLINNENDDALLKKYKSLCKRAGGLLRTFGLIQFLTFLAAKGSKQEEKHHLFLLEQIREELKEQSILDSGNKNVFLSKVQGLELPEYMMTTAETLKFLQWHKRISDILIQGNA
ncbi:MAG: type III-B CRISPR module-associated protein Cmr5 [Desulforegulaceae bacterium]|jgi:CRISPR type III-B/RAMP module-associated protein Cmr5|nr:type III-B CRISPR module-associated protein Cmr5 [Desulforegulaceae bacterium]